MAGHLPHVEILPSTMLTVLPEVIVKSMGDDEGGVLLRRDSGEMFTANETTIFFLKEIDGQKDLRTIAKIMARIFDVTAEEVENDLLDLARELLEQRIVQIVEAT